MTYEDEQNCLRLIGLSKCLECEPCQVIDACQEKGILTEEEASEFTYLLIQYKEENCIYP